MTQASASGTVVQAHRQPERDEGDDLGQAGQGGVEPLDLPLVGRAGITGDDAGDEHRQKPGAMRSRRRAVDEQGAGGHAQRVQPFAWQRHPAHEGHQQHPAGQPGPRADRQLQQEGTCDAAGVRGTERLAGGQQASHQCDADRVVDAGLALQDGPAAPGDLPVPQHREDRGRVSGGQRRAEQQRRPPVQAER
jgi:hypothetical protein